MMYEMQARRQGQTTGQGLQQSAVTDLQDKSRKTTSGYQSSDFTQLGSLDEFELQGTYDSQLSQPVDDDKYM